MLNVGMKHHFSKVNTRRMRLWPCLQGVQDLPCGSAHLGVNAPQVARPVTRSLWSWRRGQGWVGAALCFVTGGTLAGRLPHLGTPDFILNVLAQPVGASSSAVMAPAAPSLPGGCPNQTWAPSTSRKLWGRRALKAVWECGSLSTRAGRSAGTMSAYSSLPPLHSSSRKEPSAQETRHGSN